jgi:hypothetical protein
MGANRRGRSRSIIAFIDKNIIEKAFKVRYPETFFLYKDVNTPLLPRL